MVSGEVCVCVCVHVLCMAGVDECRSGTEVGVFDCGPPLAPWCDSPKLAWWRSCVPLVCNGWGPQPLHAALHHAGCM